jgi:hypothetical protein
MANRWKGNLVANAATSSGTDYTGKANGAWGLNSQLQQKQGGLWAKGQTVPNAPTGASAVNGDALAIISFTAPTDTGGLPITSYIVTSSPSNITATGSTSPITITGLTNGTTYTFTVTATNAAGASVPSSTTNSVTPSAVPTIGQALGGGFYAGSISTSGNGVATHYLIVSPKATGEYSDGSGWGTANTTTGITSVINGPTNSASLAALGTDYGPARFCENLTIGGYSDWYLPSKNELEVLYYFLRAYTTATVVNDTTTGANPNAVSPEPINTNYTTTNPGQTTASNFYSTTGSERFIGGPYWTSSESESNFTWAQHFYGGLQSSRQKNSTTNVRAVRRIPV